jgi:energy-converting hydrogenase B subunit D
MESFKMILLLFLILCAVSVSFIKSPLISVIVFMSYSLIMSIIWFLLESPDLAITEAAVGAGISSLLFFVTLRKIKLLSEGDGDEQDQG